MSAGDWRRAIDEAAELGVEMVQFIGGEPTLHPALPELVDRALGRGLTVEVFSNLVRVTAPLWELFGRPGIRLATSYYSDRACEHERITSRPGSHSRTRANIAEAVRRSIPLRVGVIDVADEQRSDQAVMELLALGVTDVGVDRLREVGRGVRGGEMGIEQLCGRCADAALAVSASGDVWPCVFSRWLPVGNVRERGLGEVLESDAARHVTTQLADQFARRAGACLPTCYPACSPSPCQPSCSPRCSPTCSPIDCGPRACWPAFSRTHASV